MFQNNRHILAVMLIAALLLCVSPLVAQDNARITALAKTIAKLRGQVDDQYQQLNAEQRTNDVQVTALKTELESLKLQADRAQARSVSLDKLVRDQRAKLTARRGDKDTLRDALQHGCQQLRTSIAQTSPLQRQARLTKLDELCARVKSGAITTTQGLDQLVSLTRDELQLSQTTQLTRQKITIDGKPRLVPVVALGTAIMYWQLEDGRVGMVARSGQKWTSTETPESKAAIKALHKAQRTSSQNAIIQLPLPPSAETKP